MLPALTAMVVGAGSFWIDISHYNESPYPI